MNFSENSHLWQIMVTLAGLLNPKFKFVPNVFLGSRARPNFPYLLTTISTTQKYNFGVKPITKLVGARIQKSRCKICQKSDPPKNICSEIG